jgi:hypothetical protein
MLIIGYTTVLQKWKDGKAEVKSAHPLPDPKVLNNEIPVAEWELDLAGKPTEPWKLTYVIYMIDLKTGAIFTYVNSTYGAMLAYNNLEEQIGVMRMLRGEHVFPIVHLEKRPMKTQFGMKTRPHLHIVDWRAAKGGGGGPRLAPQSPTPQLAGPAPTAPTPAAPATAPAAAPTAAPAPAPAASAVLANTQPVKPVTVAELIADELPPWA